MISRGRSSIAGILAALVLLVVGFFCLPINAWAAEIQAEGIHVALESDQDSYVPGDVATFTLSATNQSEQTLQMVSYALSLPENMTLRDSASAENDLGDLAPNEMKTIQVSATVLDGSSAMLVSTGDSDLIWTTLSIVLVCMLLFAFLLRDRKPAPVTFRKVSWRSCMAASPERSVRIKRRISKTSQTALSILVAFGLLGFIPFTGISQAHADEPLQSVRVSHTVNIAENEHEIAASFSFGRGGAEGWGASDATSLPEGDLSFGSSGDDGYSGSFEVATSHGGNSRGVVYQDGVIEVKDYEVEDGLYHVDLAQYSLKEGDRVVFLPTAEYPQGAAGSLVSVVAGDDGTAAIALEQAQSLSDVFERINIKETSVRADFGELELADGVELVGEDYARIAATEKDELGSVKVKVPLSETADAIIKFTPTVELSADWTLSEGFKRFDIGFSDKMEISIEGELFELKKNVPLLSKPLPLITDGISCIGVMPALEAKLDGRLDVKFELVSSVDIIFENGGFRTKSSTTSDLDAELEVKGSAGIAPYVTASVLGIELVDFELDAGLEAKASITERPNGMRCVDAKANVFMNVVCGKNTEWMKALHVTLSRKLITADNCPTKCKWALHSEDGSLVPECTYGKQTEGTDDDCADGGERMSWSCNEEDKWNEYCSANACVYGGSELLIESDDWFDFKYSTNYDAPMGFPQGAVFRVAWKGVEDDAWHERYYADDIVGVSPVHKGKVKITVFNGHVDLFDTACLNQAPSLIWGECDEIPYPLHISDSAIELNVGESFQLTCWQNISDQIPALNDLPAIADCEDVWWSAFEECVTVNSDGVVTAISPGYSYIYCDYRGFLTMCTVTVK